MKGKIKQIEEKNFEPFVLEFTVESAEEARLLWHVFNRLNLKHAIFNALGYGDDMNYNQLISCDMVNWNLKRAIENKLKEFGLSIYS